MNTAGRRHWRRSLVAIALALMLGAATAPVAGSDEQLVPLTTVAAGTASGIRTVTLAVIRNAAEWTSLWRKHMVGTGGKDAANPRIDFTQHMIVAVFAGEVDPDTRATIIKVVQEAGRLRVVYRIATPQPGPMPPDFPASTPFHIVRLARSPLPVVFAPVVEKDIY